MDSKKKAKSKPTSKVRDKAGKRQFELRISREFAMEDPSSSKKINRAS